MSDGTIRLRAWMESEGVTQEQLAERLGVHQTAVSSWLSGATPKIKQAVALARVTEIPVEAWAMPERRESLPPTGT